MALMEHFGKKGADLSTLRIDSEDEHSAQGSSIMLPPELLSLVCELLPKQALKQVRQVSKTWEQAAVPYLFDQIFMSLEMADLLIAKLVIHHFKQYIRVLVFSSVYYREMGRDEFVEHYRAFHTDPDTAIVHSTYAFKLYRSAQRDQQKHLETGLVSAYLSFALTSCPNVRKIILTDSPSSRSMSWKSLQVFEPRRSKNCPVKGCDLNGTKHFPARLRWSGFTLAGSPNPWRLILQALSVTDSDISELTMLPEDRETMVTTFAFSMTSGELKQVKLRFQTLTKIRLLFAWNPEPTAGGTYTNIAKLLSCAVNLAHLALAGIDDDEGDCGCPLQWVLGGCAFPKLKSLILGFFEFSEAELLRLLTPSKGLQHLTIECLILKEGSWMRIAEWIRASLPSLRKAHLYHLHGGFEDAWPTVGYVDVYGNIGEFLFGQGENPFSAKALAKYYADLEREREMDWWDPSGKAFFDICDRYH